MKRFGSFLVLILLTFLFALAGCGVSDEQLIGTWEYNEDGLKSVYVFKADGTGSQTITIGENKSAKNYTYKTKDGKILITFENDNAVFEYGYRFSGRDLILKDSFDEELTCKKK